MCEMCDGKTLDEIHLEMHLRIADRGWYVVAVEGDGSRRGPWAYTVGLCDGYGHPELVVADVSRPWEVLDAFAQAVHDEEEWYCAGDVIDFGDGRSLRMLRVHQSHFRTDLLNGWHRYYDDVGPPSPDLRALQVVLSDEWFCSVHGNPQRDLSRPAPTARTGGDGRRRRRGRH